MSKRHSASSNTKLAFFLNLIFTIIEFIGGFLTNSMAILSDAVHDLGDSISLGSSWYLQKLSNKGSNNRYSFGYKRFSTLGALISGTILFFGSIYVLTEAIPRLFDPPHPDAQGMLWLAVLGVGVNGFAAWRLHKGSSMNESVLSWHLLEDLLGWIGVLVVSCVLLFKDIHILDPILSISITSFVLFNVTRKLIKTIKIFLDAVPEDVDLEGIKAEVEGLDAVERTEHFHIWSIDGEVNAMSVHLYLSKNLSSGHVEELKSEVKDIVSEINIIHSIIEVHPPEK
ncbi:cation transporter [Bacillus salacetis]|uniref:Cation transporter n=1 Tax=Bacillus salacetis TaxID=2315464 RepID=A0A3A1R7A4_9BACI|nr:cation diffusion facilitator family transporter [Bacillus salacetis]RIW38357.1 cation transporter [Bacillus salacetis]